MSLSSFTISFFSLNNYANEIEKSDSQAELFENALFSCFMAFFTGTNVQIEIKYKWDFNF